MDIAEKRVYDDDAGTQLLAVGSNTGLVLARISGAIVGEFGLGLRAPVEDLAVLHDGGLAVATDKRVVVVDPPAEAAAPGAVTERATLLEQSATALTVPDDRLIAVTEEGVLACDPTATAPEWQQLGTVGNVTAADGALVGTDDGLYRIEGTALEPAGLDEITAVAAGQPILAGTTDGLYRLANGWVHEHDGTVTAVASTDGRALCTIDDHLQSFDNHGWQERSWEHGSPPVALVAGEPNCVVTEAGELAVADGDGWRTRTIGTQGVTCCRRWL